MAGDISVNVIMYRVSKKSVSHKWTPCEKTIIDMATTKGNLKSVDNFQLICKIS